MSCNDVSNGTTRKETCDSSGSDGRREIACKERRRQKAKGADKVERGDCMKENEGTPTAKEKQSKLEV